MSTPTLPRLHTSSDFKKLHRIRLGPLLEVQDRDIELFKLFGVFQLASSLELHPFLAGPSPDAFPNIELLRRRLALLAHPRNQYLVHLDPDEPLVYATGRGRPHHLYMLGSRGADVLRDAGRTLPRRDFTARAKNLSPASYDHSLLTTRAMGALIRGVEALPDLEIAPDGIFPDGTFEITVSFSANQRQQTLTIQPDGTVIVVNKQTSTRLGVVLEIDCNSERRRDLRGSSPYKNVTAYHHWISQDAYKKALGVDEILILTSTVTPRRRDTLRALAHEVVRKYEPNNSDPKSIDAFCFTTTDQYSITEPTRILTEKIWTTAAGPWEVDAKGYLLFRGRPGALF